MGRLTDYFADRIALNPNVPIAKTDTGNFDYIPKSIPGSIDSAGINKNADFGITAQGLDADSMDKSGPKVPELPSASAGADSNT